MTHAWLEAAWILALAFAVAVAVTPWLTALFPMDRETTKPGGGLQRSIERLLLRGAGQWPPREMTPAAYAAATVVMHAVGFVVLLALLRLQGALPWNPDRLPAVPWGIAINTAVSFVTNTNWQSYAGETTLSPLSQVCGLTVQNFVSAAIGLCALAAVVRGFARQASKTIGNFWQDLVRGTVALLLPLATLVAAILVWQGAAQSLATAQAEERDNSPIYFSPNISMYTA